MQPIGLKLKVSQIPRVFCIFAFCVPHILSSAAIYPPGGKAGTTIEATISGNLDSWPAEFHLNFDGVKIEPKEKKGEVIITIAKDAQAGPRLIRALTVKGVSDPFFFVVSDQPEILEVEPNNRLDEAQKIKNIPVVLNGKLEKNGDTDFYKIHLEKGFRFSARLDAYSLMSPIDAFIHIYEPHGYEVAVASDTHNLDPLLLYTVKETGVHTLQVLAVPAKASTGISYYGTADSVYRLALGEDSLPLAPKSRFQEKEAPESLPVPSSVSGSLSMPGEIDTFRVIVPKRDQVTIRVEAQTLHYPTDPVLLVFTSPGSLLKETDDDPNRKSPDPEYLLRSGMDEPYLIQVTDRFGHGGDRYHYRLVLEKPEPSFLPVVVKDTFNATPGKDVEIKVMLNRSNGHKLPLHATLPGIPEGFQVKGYTIAPDAKFANLKLTPLAGAPPGNHPFRIVILEDTIGSPVAIQANFSLQTNESRGDYLINETPWVWVTVPNPAPNDEKKSKQEQPKEK
jgi:hypothetical protein